MEERMDKRMKVAIIGLSVVMIFVLIAAGLAIKEKLTPSSEVMPLTDYYQVADSEVMIILQDKIYENRGMFVDGEVYIDYETIVQEFNHRFYWDSRENILTYTTPTEILRAEAGSSDYTVTKTLNSTVKKADYEIVKVFADKVYVALDFVGEYSDMEYQFYEKPNRVVINYKWTDYLCTEVAKATQLRTEPGIKNPILSELPIGAALLYVDVDEVPRKGFVKVMTEDGIIGYVKEKNVKKSFYKTFESSFKAPEYTAQTREGKICLAFHQVSSSGAVESLEANIKATKGVTVVSPTWFKVNDSSGAISSAASEAYVDKAKELGIEVWALVSDVDIKVDMGELLSRTSTRDTLSNSLIQAALDYKLNGINIDFETIPSSSGTDYAQFLRELSVKCRNNGIVLSVDNFVPAPYNEHYNLEEQGQILDYVIIMAYNEFTGTEEAGPVASIGFVEDAINNTLEVVPAEKTIIAIPFWSKLWKETEDGTISSENLGMTKAANVFTDHSLTPEWDEGTGYNYGEYKMDGATYRIWQEDETSIDRKMSAIYNANTAGVAAWKLGLDRETVWDVIIKYLNQK
jgi:spore germination protein YaaH